MALGSRGSFTVHKFLYLGLVPDVHPEAAVPVLYTGLSNIFVDE